MIVRTWALSALSKIALFGAGVFFHGAADHAMTATIGRAPDILSSSAPVAEKWLLAGFDVTLTWLLYEIHLWYGRKARLTAAGFGGTSQ
jgi:hypothetical protein